MEPELGKNLGEGDRYVNTEGEKKPSASNIMMPDVSMEAEPPVGGENQESNKRDPPSLEPDVEMGLVGHPPKSIPMIRVSTKT